MKYLKNTLKILLVVFASLSILSILFTIMDNLQLNFDWSRAGFIYFLGTFKVFGGLFTGTIALMSVFYWIFQMEVSQKTLDRIKKETIDKKKENTVEASDKFYIEITPALRKLYEKLNSANPGLLTSNWNLDEFTDESVDRQNRVWEVIFEEHRSKIQEDVINFNSMLEAFSARINYGVCDDELAFELFGKAYCQIINWLYPFIAGYRGLTRRHDYYNNIVKLYKNWSAKLS